MKVGRTNDTTRRLSELNSGLPPGADLRWTLAYIERSPDSNAAHQAEQRILASLAKDPKTSEGSSLSFARLKRRSF